ncbi:MAG: hypothetical protein ACI9DJ_003391 [Algoriphagus sp.]|jgi:hypothetical protein
MIILCMVRNDNSPPSPEQMLEIIKVCTMGPEGLSLKENLWLHML